MTPQLTLNDFLQNIPLANSALNVINKLIYKPSKAYTTSTDGQTYFQFGAHLPHHLKTIHKQITKHNYTWKPLKKTLKRTKNKLREIYLSCWDDKIVENWLNDNLNTLLNTWLSNNSYAYRGCVNPRAGRGAEVF